MRIVVYVLIALVALMMVLCYALVANSSRISREEERRKAMEKEKDDDRNG
jgi:hypothetical protein